MKTFAEKASAIRTIVIFVLLGPPLGYAVFCLWTLAVLPAKDSDRPLSHALRVMLTGFPAGYAIGTITALFAGSFVIASEARSRVTWLHVAGIGLIIGSVIAIAVRPDFSIEGLLAVSVGLVPTLLCWRLSRLWQARLSEPGLQ